MVFAGLGILGVAGLFVQWGAESLFGAASGPVTGPGERQGGRERSAGYASLARVYAPFSSVIASIERRNGLPLLVDRRRTVTDSPGPSVADPVTVWPGAASSVSRSPSW